METARSSEMSVDFYQTTQRHIAEEVIFIVTDNLRSILPEMLCVLNLSKVWKQKQKYSNATELRWNITVSRIQRSEYNSDYVQNWLQNAFLSRESSKWIRFFGWVLTLLSVKHFLRICADTSGQVPVECSGWLYWRGTCQFVSACHFRPDRPTLTYYQTWPDLLV
jgi:hypothetical protein